MFTRFLKRNKSRVMGIILWGFVLMLLFCGPEFAIAMYAGAVVVGIIWGIRNIIKERK